MADYGYIVVLTANKHGDDVNKSRSSDDVGKGNAAKGRDQLIFVLMEFERNRANEGRTETLTKPYLQKAKEKPQKYETGNTLLYIFYF